MLTLKKFPDMSDEYTTDNELDDNVDRESDDDEAAESGGFGSMFVNLADDVVRQQLRGMFQSWYLDYAS